MPNDQSFDTRTTNPANRSVGAVGLSVAAVASGGAALGFNAPSGVADNELITVTTNGETFNFGTGPSKKVAFGFGQGQLYTETPGTALGGTYVDPLTSSEFRVEGGFGEGRLVEEIDGIRAISTTQVGSTIGGGLIGWDYGVSLPENEKLFISRVSRGDADFQDAPGSDGFQWYEILTVDSDTQITMTSPYASTTDANQKMVIAVSQTDETGKYEFIGSVTNGSAIVTGTGFLANASPGDAIGDYTWTQWKELRVASGFTLSGNDWYLKKTQGSRTGGALESVLQTEYGAGPFIENEWYRLDTSINMGSLGVADGTFKNKRFRPALGTPTESVFGAENSVLLHRSDFRLQWVMFQEFATYVTNCVLRQTDIYIQSGSWARFELADGATPAETTEAYILPATAWSSTQCTVMLWKSLFPSYTGKFIHFYDDDGVFQEAVAL